jgi:GT2 family glycosyltransferase
LSLSIVIVSFNARDFLRRCLETVLPEARSVSADVIVVDNHSRDGSADMVWKDFPEVHLIANTMNLGYSAANNQGLRMSRADFAVLLNPDTEVRPGCFKALLDFMEAHPDVGACAPQLLNTDGSIQFSCRRFPGHHTALFSRFAVLTRLFPNNRYSTAYLMTDEGHDQERETDWLSGAAILVRRSALNQVGLFDERFFMYCEDVDFCYRLRQAGWRVCYVPRGQIVHHIGASSEKTPLRACWEHHRSMYLFYKKHYSRGIPLLDAITLLGVIMRGGFLLGARGGALTAKAFQRGSK